MTQKITHFLALSICVFAFTSTATYGQRWDSFGNGKDVGVSNCSHCNEDVAIDIECNGRLPATVNVQHLSAYQGQKENIRITVGGRSYDREADTGYNALVGEYPVFYLRKNDRLINAMKTGSSIRLSYGGNSITVGLSGSRKALERFEQECGWKKKYSNSSYNSNNSSNNSNNSSYDLSEWYFTSKVKYGISDGFLSLRKGPGPGWTRITKLDEGTGLQFVERSGSWKKVRLSNGTVGWVKSRYTTE